MAYQRGNRQQVRKNDPLNLLEGDVERLGEGWQGDVSDTRSQGGQEH